jgi:hypothetical protein
LGRGRRFRVSREGGVVGDMEEEEELQERKMGDAEKQSTSFFS